MASMELDPVYAKGLRLLHSKSKDSEEQLRQMVEDLIKQRNGNTKTIAMLQKRDSSSKKDKHSSSSSSSKKDDLKRESEKQSYDEGTSSRELKKSKSELSKSTHLKSSSTPNSPLSPAKSYISDIDMKEEIKEEDDHDDIALEMLEEDLTCVVCRGMDVSVSNQLVECLECHSLYHQECHNPPVPDDMNDPRSAWYCASCSKALKKVPSNSRSSPKPMSGSSSSRDRDIATTKTVKSESSQSQSPFKRSEKVLSRQSKSSSQPYSRSQPQGTEKKLPRIYCPKAGSAKD